MSSLDENMDTIDQAEVPYMNTALKYGLIGGGIATVWTLLAGIFNLAANWMLGLVVGVGIYAVVAYLAIKQHRDNELGGYITLGRAFLVSLVAAIITGIIGGLMGYIYYNLIDPNAIDLALEASAEMMEGFGLSGDQLDEALEQARGNFTLPKMMLNSVIGAGILGGLISLIMGAIMKKEAPMV